MTLVRNAGELWIDEPGYSAKRTRHVKAHLLVRSTCGAASPAVHRTKRAGGTAETEGTLLEPLCSERHRQDWDGADCNGVLYVPYGNATRKVSPRRFFCPAIRCARTSSFGCSPASAVAPTRHARPQAAGPGAPAQSILLLEPRKKRQPLPNSSCTSSALSYYFTLLVRAKFRIHPEVERRRLPRSAG